MLPLPRYLASEVLEGDAAYYCDGCRRKVDRAEKTSELAAAPRHLILALSRFRYDASSKSRRKVDTKLKVTHDLDLPSGHRYALYAVVVHSGKSPHHGHYYAYGRDSDSAAAERDRGQDPDPGAWNVYDDLVVRRGHRDRPLAHDNAASPYLLFYARVDADDGLGAAGAEPARGGTTALRPDLQHYLDKHNEQYDLERRTQLQSTPSVDARRPPAANSRGGGSGPEPWAGGGGAGSWGSAH